MWVVVEMSLHNEIGNADWGLYSALLSFSFLLVALADLGVNQYLMKTLASAPERMRTLYPSLLGLKLTLMLLYPSIMIGLGWLVGYRGIELGWLAALSLVWGLHQMGGYFRANFQAMQRFRLDSLASVLDRVILLVLVGILFFTGIEIERFIGARLLGAAITAGILYGLLQRIYGWIAPKMDPKNWRKWVRLSLPFALITILNSIHDKIDQVMLERMIDSTETGLYAAAYRIMDVFNMYLWTTLTILMARFAYHIHKPESLTQDLRFGQIIVSFPMMFVAVFVFFFGEKLLIIYSDFSAAEIAITAQCLKVLFAASLIHSVWVIYGTFLSMIDHERYVNKVILAGILVNVGLNLAFIPAYGALAAAWSTVASFGLICAGYVWRTHTHTDVDVPYGLMLRLWAAWLLALGVFWTGNELGLPWWATTLLAGIAYLVAGVAFGLLRKSVFSNNT